MRQPDPGHHRAEHTDPDRRGRHGLGDSGRPGGGVQGIAPSVLAALRFGDDVGQCAGDAKLRRMFESDHRRGVPVGMVLARNLFLRDDLQLAASARATAELRCFDRGNTA